METRYRWASLILFHVALVVILLTFTDYGTSIDEDIQHRYGRMILDYYRTGGEDQRAITHYNLYFYGGIFDMTAVALSDLLPLRTEHTRHLLNALVGLIAVLGCWRVAERLGGPRAAFFAALFLLVTPRFYGHMFINPKDIPFAAGYIWSLWFLLGVLPHLPRPPVKGLVGLGVALGLTLAVRSGALLLFGYLGLAFALSWLSVLRRDRGRREALAAGLRLGASFALVWGTAVVVMLPFWPWAQANPVTRPVESLLSMADFTWQHAVLFFGRWIKATALPATYIPAFIGITLPVVFLVLLGIGSLLAGRALGDRRRRRGAEGSPRAAGGGLVLLAVVFPIGFVAASGSVLYNGLRHLLFVLPPLIALTGWACHALLERVETRRPRAGRAVLVAVGVGLILPVTWMVRLHPYQYVYFNELVGGVQGADGRFELDYWRTSLPEAVRALSARLEREADGSLPRGHRVIVNNQYPNLERCFPDYLSLASHRAEADFVIEGLGRVLEPGIGGTPWLEVERAGVPLSVVYDCRSVTRASTGSR